MVSRATYTLSLHDALPIFAGDLEPLRRPRAALGAPARALRHAVLDPADGGHRVLPGQLPCRASAPWHRDWAVCSSRRGPLVRIHHLIRPPRLPRGEDLPDGQRPGTSAGVSVYSALPTQSISCRHQAAPISADETFEIANDKQGGQAQ